MSKSKVKDAEPALFKTPAAAPPPSAARKRAVAVTGHVGRGSGPPPAVPKIGSGVVPYVPKSRLELLATIAADPRADAAKTREFLEMDKEVRAEEARRAFTRAKRAMRPELPTISASNRIEIRAKDSKGERTGRLQQSTPYASFNAIHKAVMPILHKHGFDLWYEPDAGPEGRIILRGHLDHEDGHGVACALLLPFESSGSKNNVQAIGSSIAYGKRYATISLLNIISEAPQDADLDGATVHVADDDPGPAPVKKITGVQAKTLLKAIDECGVEATMFMDKYAITAVHELPADQFAAAMTSCENYAKRKKGDG